MVTSTQRNAWRNLRQPILVAGIIFFGIRLDPSNASAEITIDLTYDSVMDMVRPEQHPGIRVHHNLQIVFSGGTVVENRDRNTKNLSDRKCDGPRFRRCGCTDDLCVLARRDEHSIGAHPRGFSEYAFLRISTHTLAYFSSYRVIRTSCSIQ